MTMPTPLRPLLDRTLPELRTEMSELGLESWRADQIFSWLYKKGVLDFAGMTDIGRPTREALTAVYQINAMAPKEEKTAGDRSATKCLFALADGREIEGVFLRLPNKETICFSTQVGCAIGCGFCVTALMGRLRNLEAGEIVGQILYLSRKFVEREQGFNLVAMGMGEPFDNYENLLKAIRIMKEVRGLNIGPRRITISTSGIVPMIDRLATEGIPLGLAVSLNATTNEQRSELMPINKKYPIEELLEAAGRYARATNRRVTLEYVMLRGVNDSEADARRLINLASRLPSKINLIPFNPSPYHSFSPPTPAETERFQDQLLAADKTVTIRRRRGGDIYAACGQLGVTQAR
ncbi:MAG: 23S rRNA (adenine(2503)-C(2))-methyltransferase RlmN [Candidatus Eisenbacteria bacterium]|nr:23S rRNA (adenine(2503)-C(2))-methyltransferase RlmN [Candidatus Eisenbacteria bacterium]